MAHSDIQAKNNGQAKEHDECFCHGVPSPYSAAAAARRTPRGDGGPSNA